MGRTIGGFFVGFIGMIVISVILSVIFAFVVGAEGIIDLETKEPTQVWTLVGMILGAAAAFMGGFFARAVGKSKAAPISLIVVMLIMAIWGIVGGTGEIPAETLKQMEENASNPLMAMQFAQINAQQSMAIIGGIVSMIAMAIGGLKMTDFKGTPDDQETRNSEAPM